MTPMIEHLNDLVREVGQCSGDEELAHMKEDDLHQFVLRKIADGNFGEASKWAEKALETKKYDFRRYYS